MASTTPAVSGGGGMSPDLAKAIADVQAAIAAIRAAIEGQQAIGGGAAPGPAATGCTCAGGQAQAGAGAMGAPTAKKSAGANGAPDAEMKKSKKGKKGKSSDKAADKPAEAGGAGSAPQGTKLVNPLPGASKTSPFGPRNGRAHEGQDLAKPSGTPIVAAASGKVVESKSDPSGYGNFITIDHGNGRYTRYAHLVSPSPLKAGDTIEAGKSIGKVGSTGNSTGPHLHFEVMIGGLGNQVDPAPYLSGSKTL